MSYQIILQCNNCQETRLKEEGPGWFTIEQARTELAEQGWLYLSAPVTYLDEDINVAVDLCPDCVQDMKEEVWTYVPTVQTMKEEVPPSQKDDDGVS